MALTAARTTSLCCGYGGNRELRKTVGGSMVEVSVSFRDAWSRLICAGWLPQDRVFGWERSAGIRTSVAKGIGPPVAHSLGTRCSSRCDLDASIPPRFSSGAGGFQSGNTASDQHHPASSRATATLAITARFLRRFSPTQRACSRWLPAWARARAAAEA